jgi:hypothetical protein
MLLTPPIWRRLEMRRLNDDLALLGEVELAARHTFSSGDPGHRRRRAGSRWRTSGWRGSGQGSRPKLRDCRPSQATRQSVLARTVAMCRAVFHGRSWFGLMGIWTRLDLFRAGRYAANLLSRGRASLGLAGGGFSSKHAPSRMECFLKYFWPLFRRSVTGE